MKLSQLRDLTQSLHLTFGEYVLNVEFRPYAYTPELEEINARAQEDASAGDTLKHMLLPVLAKWDLVDDYQIVKELKEDVAPPDDEQTELFVYEDKVVELHPSCVVVNGEVIEKVVPLTKKGLHKIPVRVLGEILLKIGEALTPGKQTAFDSAGSF